MIGILAVCAVMCVFLLSVKQIKPEIAAAVSLCMVCVLLAAGMAKLSPIFELIDTAAKRANLNSDSVAAVLKSVGVCLVGGICSDICKSAGENAVASAAQVCTGIAVLIIAAPLIGDILKAALELAGG
ncbi:MAG: hypothetical protein IJL87_02345 [Clostridia bacterium]|nr:hypothetical protein [Clostridia bacterium]